MAKVEEMIAKAKKVEEKRSQWTPRDCIMNPLVVGDVVVIGYNCNGPVFGKIISIDEGGIETPNGPTLTRTRIVADLVMMSGPKEGGMCCLKALAKSVNPASQLLVDGLVDLPTRS